CARVGVGGSYSYATSYWHFDIW
nr:immunoglobulin heavy chain junction region [Macaca mulatta]MOV48195.1 immunoglobulin heavy chain junction region [Macaca mulatta]